VLDETVDIEHEDVEPGRVEGLEAAAEVFEQADAALTAGARQDDPRGDGSRLLSRIPASPRRRAGGAPAARPRR
jgi:hypothetical protein